MTVLALDLSTNTGYSVFRDGELVRSGTLWSEKPVSEYGHYPWSYVLCADSVATRILQLLVQVIREDNPDIKGDEPFSTLKLPDVVIEETTASRSNYDQKILEFIHLSVINALSQAGIVKFNYVRDGVWKRVVGATQNKDERRHNAQIAREKKRRELRLLADTSISPEEKERLSKLPVKIGGKVKGKLTRKHYAVRAVRDIFGKDLKQKDTNEADAILLGLAFVKGVPICDGTAFGGLLAKDE